MPDVPAEPPYLATLNAAQREAVQSLDGPLLILAGAGTGKTRVLTTRLAHLLATGRAFPGQILAVTFTNKAAREMRERVAALLGGKSVDGWWLGTFHALAARMLRRHAECVGLTSSFTILDTDDQVRLIKQLSEENNLDPKKLLPKTILGQIDRWKDKALTPADITASEVGGAANGALIVKMYRAYQARLKQLNACDFGDLLLHMITIFKDPEHNTILSDYHRQFRYVLVDEYQDTNLAQYLWLKYLAAGHNNIACVGDDDQSIYGWRGAEIDNILRFEKDFPGAKVVRLEQNYRSTNRILKAAGAVISQNEGRLGKTLWSEGEEGEPLIVRGLWDGEAEARWVGEEIEALQSKKFGLDQVAVLVRAGFQMREFEERFIQLGLPYQVIGGPRFYERQEIRDALAYLRVVAQPADDLALERILNVPKRGLGDTTLKTLYAHARGTNIPLYQAIAELIETDELKSKIRETLRQLHGQFELWRASLESENYIELTERILEDSGYMEMWRTTKTPDAPGRLENLKEMLSGMHAYDDLRMFLEHVALVLDAQSDTGQAQITLMTLHGAKGLEFDVIFLPGWEEGLFPSQRSMDENGIKGLEEERRLAYVGITRAKQKAYISYVGNRRIYGNWTNAIPSRFIDELPAEHVSAQNEEFLTMGRSAHWDSSGFNVPARQSFFVGVPQSGQGYKKVSERTSSEEYAPGARIVHDSFGYGTVVHKEGRKLDIHFDDGTQKRVMDGFVQPAGDR